MPAGTPCEWLSAADVAELALPGVPSTKQNVLKLAEAEGWSSRRGDDGMPLVRSTTARGGERQEFHVSLLPMEAREALELRALAANDAGEPERRDWDWLKRQPLKVRNEVKRRLEVLATVMAHENADNVRSAAVSRAAQLHGISARTVWDWLNLVKGAARADWGPALAPAYKGGRQAADVDPGAWSYLLSIYLKLSGRPWRDCYREMVDKYAKPRGIQVPSHVTLKRKLDREVPAGAIVALREGKVAAANMLPTQRRSVAQLTSMQCVNIDGHTFDVFVNFGTAEKPIKDRPVLIGIADVRSRKLLAWRIGRSENTAMARLAFLDLFQNWGAPEVCVLDNGRAFASRVISGGSQTRNRFPCDADEAKGILATLGVEMRWTKPYRGRSKPIERTWKDLCGSISQHWKMDGAYTGNAPHKKPENYGKRMIALDDFVAFVADRITEHNARPDRETEVCKGVLSFDQAFAASYEANGVRWPSKAQLRDAFLERKTLTLSRKTGEIEKLFGNRYYTEELMQHRGKKVIVRFDPDNLAEPVDVYLAKDETFIATARLIGDSNFLSTEDAKKTGQEEARHRKDIRKATEALELLRQEELDAIYGSIPTSETEKPRPGSLKLVQDKPTTARAVKRAASAAAMPVHDPLDDAFAAALAANGRRLRAV